MFDPFIFSERHREAYCRNLAAALLHSDWSAKSLRRFAKRAVGPRHRWLGGLLERLRIHFAEPPRDDALIAFVKNDEELLAAWERACRRDQFCPEPEEDFHFPYRMQSPAVPLLRPVPEIETPGKLAAWLGIPIHRLDWYADLKGLNASATENLRHYQYHWRPKPGSVASACSKHRSRC